MQAPPDIGTTAQEEPESGGPSHLVATLAVAVALGAVVLAVPEIRAFLDDHGGAVVVVGLIALGLSAWWAVRLTIAVYEIARAGRKLAEATRVMAVASARREPPGPIPVIAFELVPEPRVNRFTVSVTNVGTGPALGLSVELVDSPLRFRQEPPSRSRALGPGHAFEATFLLEEETPFVDPAHPNRWPRNDEDAQAIADATQPPRHERSGMVLDPDLHMHRLQELQERYGAYRLELLEAIAREVTHAGVLTAWYEDLSHEPRRSIAAIEISESDRPDRPGQPRLGALRVDSPAVT
jgi:hypothetical protein